MTRDCHMSDAARDTGVVLDPKWDERGLIQAVATDASSGAVLMVAHMNPTALAATLATGEAHYWSRSRAEVWHKGATSGNVQRVVAVRIDCDQDAVWLSVEPARPGVPHGRGVVLLPCRARGRHSRARDVTRRRRYRTCASIAVVPGPRRRPCACCANGRRCRRCRSPPPARPSSPVRARPQRTARSRCRRP